MIENKKLQISFFFLLFGLSSYMLYLVYQPFLQVIAVASVLAVLLYPLYKKFMHWTSGHKSLSAMMVVLLAIIFLATPLYFLGAKVLSEAQALYTNVSVNSGSVSSTITNLVEKPIHTFSPNFTLDIQMYLSKFAQFLLSNFGPIVSGTAIVTGEFLLTLVALFSFLKFGDIFLASLIKLSPLDDDYDREILSSVQKTINSVIQGSLMISVIQGLLVGTGLYLFHVPNPYLWGMLTVICALIPGIGTAIITIPSVLYLVIMNDTTNALGLFLWSVFLVGTIDNILAPYLFNRGIKIYPIFVFFAVLGGIAAFGPMGFLFGPIVLSVFLSVLHIYKLFILEEKEL